MIGKGAFGKVYLVQNRNTQKVYAMKCIRKDVVIDQDFFESLKLEKDILYNVEHPFIVSMDFVFQNDFRIYFLMNFIKGGELFRHLTRVKRFNEEQAQFLIAQVALALGHLHKKNILYRDLKPENVLFNEDGYLLLADFGLAKMTKGKKDQSNSFCGTPEYLSPEMIIGSGHDNTVDWWTLGVLLYELLVGITPFFHRNNHRMQFLIQECPVTFPDKARIGFEVSPVAKDLIRRLLDKDKTKRLGAKDDMTEVLAHPFFQGLDIEKLIKKELVPPYKPEVGDDFKYFDKKLTDLENIGESVIDKSRVKLIQQNQHIFNKF
jgi:serum/glucocorticoid-regulated kinase 2